MEQSTPNSHERHNWTDESPARLEELMVQLQLELRQIAARCLAHERAGHTLQPTALVNEAYLRLAQQNNLQKVPKHQFLAAAVCSIRRILVDHARAKRSEKRGGGQRIVTMGFDAPAQALEFDLIALNDALETLGKSDQRAAKVVEMRFFGGLTVAETADSLRISERAVADDWAFARAWLRRQLES